MDVQNPNPKVSLIATTFSANADHATGTLKTLYPALQLAILKKVLSVGAGDSRGVEGVLPLSQISRCRGREERGITIVVNEMGERLITRSRGLCSREAEETWIQSKLRGHGSRIRSTL
ncbi:hypothetical protein L1887_35201 [Cichorium endivia]|nr:hypothetical protein L1887_35201 [Cichorium endivia]